MDERKTTENRRGLMGLSVLAVITAAVWCFMFLGLGDLWSKEPDPVPDSSAGASTDDSTNTEDLSAVIAEVQEKMNRFQTQLASPYLTLVGESNPLPEGYTVELMDLVGDGAKNRQMETAAAGKMNEFLAAAEKSGFHVTVTAAYRTEAAQKKAYDAAVQDYMNAGYPAEIARSMAASSVGSVNRSEHQSGYAVDFSAKELTLLGSDGRTFEEYLTDTIYKYGFILSYPAGEEESTGHAADTTHYRYVGVSAAAEMREKHFTLPEYRDYLETQIEVQKQYIDSLKKK